MTAGFDIAVGVANIGSFALQSVALPVFGKPKTPSEYVESGRVYLDVALQNMEQFEDIMDPGEFEGLLQKYHKVYETYNNCDSQVDHTLRAPMKYWKARKEAKMLLKESKSIERDVARASKDARLAKLKANQQQCPRACESQVQYPPSASCRARASPFDDFDQVSDGSDDLGLESINNVARV